MTSGLSGVAVANPRREVRLGLVMNGGVSLAVWIGGVTHEIDALRRATNSPVDREGPTTGLYRELLTTLRQRVVVDVIAGSSAGGINGAILAAAIARGVALPALRETWIEIGDFRRLLRSPADRHPPSLLYGDDVALPELRRRFQDVFNDGSDTPERLDCYLTATDVFGAHKPYTDSTGRTFIEREHRVSFRFSNRPESLSAQTTDDGMAMPAVVNLKDRRAAELLARAARATMSFPAAFEAYGLDFESEDDGNSLRRWLIDGGVLDNQPFNPVLNQIALMPATTPVHRVVTYVVPYVTEPEFAPGKPSPRPAIAADNQPAMLRTVSASSELPRGLPKLEGLERVRRDEREAREANLARRDLHETMGDSLIQAARPLLVPYRRTRGRATLRTILAWGQPSFHVGTGPSGSDETVAAGPPDARLSAALLESVQREPWLPPDDLDPDSWVSDDWRWGLSPAERVASEALSFLHDRAQNALVRGASADDALVRAREVASNCILQLRDHQIDFAHRVKDAVGGASRRPTDTELVTIAARVYRVADYARIVGWQVGLLDKALADVDGIPSVRQLLAAEVVRHAVAIETPVFQQPFVFLFASAGLNNALGHTDASPEQKLAGMKLNHFAGFLKRSWRANDWLWGRLDGVQHLLRATMDLDYVMGCGDVADELALLAFPDPGSNGVRTALDGAWQRTRRGAEPPPLGADARAQFASAFRFAQGNAPTGERAARLELCRKALAARIQLEILAEDLPRVASTAVEDVQDGAAGSTLGGEWARAWYRDPDPAADQLLDRFYKLRIGAEKPQDELSTRLGLKLGTQAAAVGVSALAGDRGGLPLIARGVIATVRGVTHVVAGLTRLMVDAPVLGISVLVALAVTTVWALVAPNAILGAMLPIDALGIFAMGAALLTVLTSILEPPVGRGRRAILLASLAFGSFVAAVWLGTEDIVLGQPYGHGWLIDHVGVWGARVAAVLFLAAAVMVVVRLIADRRSATARRRALRWYRWLTILAFAAIAGGVAYITAVANATCGQDEAGWECVADERRGTLLVVTLLVVSAVASIAAELTAEMHAPRRGRTQNQG